MILMGLAMPVNADEGMWLLTDPPRERLKEKYGFELTDDFLKRAMLGSVRFTNGGSGGFVSANGLVVTNHHIAADSVQKLSTAENNFYRDGFLARTKAAERKCPDLELNVLQSIDDVTARRNAAVKDGRSPADSAAARRAVMAEIEKGVARQDRPSLGRHYALSGRPVSPVSLQEVHGCEARVRPRGERRRVRRRRG